MAKIWIDNGVNFNPTWERHICYSFDNVTWLSINKEMLGVEYKVENANTASPLIEKTPTYKIIIRQVSNPNVHPALIFDLEDVQNQAGWTNDIAGVNNAIADITEWLSQCCGFTAAPLATEATLNAVLAAVQQHQEYEFLLVRDPGNSDLVVRQVIEYDEQTNTFSYSYEEIDGTPYVPIGSPVYVDYTSLLNLILTKLNDIDAQFTGDITGLTTVDISGDNSYDIPQCNSWELVVTAGTVTDGVIVYPEGVWSSSAPLKTTFPALSTNLDATGATAFIRLITI